MPFVGAGNAASIGWWWRAAGDSACPVTAEEIAFFKAIPGVLCAEDVVAPEYSLALYIFDGGVSVIAQYIVDTTLHTLDISGTGVPEETIPLTPAQELSCRDLFDASCP